MRILFTFVGGRGHFEPLVGLARAARGAGHDVAFACAPSMAEVVEAAGFEACAVGPLAGTAPQRTPLRAPDREREERDLRERFARRAARYRAPHILERCRAWKPDVLVCDETDFGAHVAAERLALPFAVVIVIAAGGFVRPDVVGEPLAELRAEHGLPPEPGLAAAARRRVLSPFPPGYRDPTDPLPATGRCFRLWEPGVAAGPAPAWSSIRPGAARVYFTLGTVFNVESGDLLERSIAGLQELPINLLVTVGDAIDPTELGAQPAHVRVERFVPQASSLPWCDLVVSHGGSGSVLGALAHGLPSLLIPIGADQPLNARRCTELGVARALDALDATPERVRAAASALLDEPAYRHHAQRVQREIAALPDASQALALLEALANGGRAS